MHGQPVHPGLGRIEAGGMAATVREVEQDMEGVGRLAALGVNRVVVVGASIKMQRSLLCM